MNHTLLTLLHLSDSCYPTGSFAHSWGLEYAISRGWVRDPAGLLAWATDALRYSFVPLEGRAALKAWDLAAGDDADALFALDKKVTSFRPTAHVRATSAQMGRSFLGITATSYEDAWIAALSGRVMESGSVHCMQHPVAWGAVFNRLGIARWEALESLLFGTVRQWTQVAMRIIPLGQKDAHGCLAVLAGLIGKLAAGEVDTYLNSDLQSVCPGFDMSCLGHESMKARYFVN